MSPASAPAVAGPLFVTGATGFVGRRLTHRLAEAGQREVRYLVRSPDHTAGPGQTVVGDLRRPGPWTAALQGVDTVVHLAALTGKASAGAHHAASVTATQLLLDAARRHQVRRFLFVSSIAAGYTDRRHYHYAEAKAAAETLVRESGLETLIVRPTLILGPGSPVAANLRRLATLPIPVTFGAGRTVQPVHVDDVVDALLAALASPDWPTDPIELGGPEVLPITELMAAFRVRAGQSPRAPIRIPIEPLRTILAACEPLLLPVLPFTAGQLAAFSNPAVVTRRPPAWCPPARRGLAAMLDGAPR